MGREIGYDSGTHKIFENREGLDTGRPRSPFGYYTKWCQLMGTGTIHAITSFPGRVGEGIFCFYGLPFGNRTSRKPKRHWLNGKRCCNAVRTGGPVTSLQQRLNGQPREQGCPFSIFEAGQCNPLLRFVLTRAEKMKGVSKGGCSPFGTRLLERSGKSLVCYTFCPGWRGKGNRRQDSRFPAPGRQAEEWSVSNHSSACFQKGQKVYTAPVPRPPSRRSDINVAACAADRSARFVPFSAPAFLSDGSAPPSLG